MDPHEYFEKLRHGLEALCGRSRVTPRVTRFGDIGVEYECHGPMMIVFLTKLNWLQNITWEGAVHIDTRDTPLPHAVQSVKKMMDVGRQRTGS